MFARVSKWSVSMRKVFLLLTVYALHLTFFQLLMTQSVHAADTNFKPLFHHSDKNKPLNPPSHPAVTYYTQLAKQGFSGLRSCCAIVAIQADIKPVELTQTITEEKNLLYPAHILSHLGADSFKLYRLLRVFLI